MTQDPWHTLRRYTQARIAQGRAGYGQRTSSLLEFQLAHAQARDAVHMPWDVDGFAKGIRAAGLATAVLSSPIQDRTQYLKRPDLGRVLDQSSRDRLSQLAGKPVDIALTFSNGLSSTALDAHGLALLSAIVQSFKPVAPSSGGHDHVVAVSTEPALAFGPVCLVPNGRVALSDEIGLLLQARLSIIVIGERPGLSAADSLGIYLTYAPKPGNTDAERNCISNVRPPEGLGYDDAAAKLAYLARKALRLGMSGVTLKDDTANNSHLISGRGIAGPEAPAKRDLTWNVLVDSESSRRPQT